MKMNTICIALIAAIVVVFTAGSASAAPDFLETKLTASDGAAGDEFGLRVAIDGDTAIVTAGADDDAGVSSGSAYIFRDTSAAGDWSSFAELKKLTASDAAAVDLFGTSVGIDSDTVIVGARGEGDAGYFSGSAYIFQDTSAAGDWSEVSETKLTASDAAADQVFGGYDVAIDGDTIIVGTYGDDDAGTDSGSAYIFQDTSAAGDWSEVSETKLTASDAAAGDGFGGFVSIDGDTVIVSAPYNDDAGYRTGSAYIFQDTSAAGDWSEVSEIKLTASDATAGDVFGYDVAIDGDTVIVGACLDDDGGDWSGSAYIFRDTSAAGDWSEVFEIKLTASDAEADRRFGRAVAIDGDIVIVGACQESHPIGIDPGAAYVYVLTTAVTIDIKPGSDPNSINLSSAGVVPVAILSSATFDATTVDPDTVSLAGAGVKMVGKSEKYLAHIEDVNDDGLPDLVCKVLTVEFIIEPGASVAVLEAQTFDGISIRGEDTVRIVPD